jgi:hypothetical protein
MIPILFDVSDSYWKNKNKIQVTVSPAVVKII